MLAELASGETVAAHLPNTGRLTHLTTPGRRYLLRPESDPLRTTRFTAVRAWDGCWVALEAANASSLLVAWLAGGHGLAGIDRIGEIRTEVGFGSHRIDIVGRAPDGVEVWIEVKSGGRAVGEVALLSQTPSTRAAGHLAALAELAGTGVVAVVAFVVQRPDVRCLRIGGDADPGWISAVEAARAAGVAVVAYGCDVTPADVTIARELPIVWEGG